MALVDLTTDLKSLKFESGLNRKPFVVKDIDQEGGRNSGLAVQGILAAKRIDDVVRMAKLVVAKPGLTYAAKTALSGFIEAADDKALYKTGPGLGKQLLDKAKDILTTAVTNTAQVPLNGLGVHLYKGNLNLDRDSRNYDSNFVEEATIRTLSTAHSSQKSQGIKKSKKLTIDQQARNGYAKIDYLTDPTNLNTLTKDVSTTGIVEGGEGYEANPDIIPFYFEVLNGDEINAIQFRAYLNTFSDSYAGMWNKTQFLGRPEQFKTYQGFERTIQIGFIAAAETRHELKPLYQKLNYLASVTAPTFSDDENSLFMRGTLVRSTVGDYLYRQLCNITQVSFSWDVNYPWEVKLNEGEEKTVQMLPHVLNVSVTAEAIHDFVPETGNVPYITNTKKDPFIEE